ncbi:hypothetical protein J1614_011454 [Plenodomus biglobosus]|nr:hypothetical protein J1614_011454 [Plenodomus biglobosus]
MRTTVRLSLQSRRLGKAQPRTSVSTNVLAVTNCTHGLEGLPGVIPFSPTINVDLDSHSTPPSRPCTTMNRPITSMFRHDLAEQTRIADAIATTNVDPHKPGQEIADDS